VNRNVLSRVQKVARDGADVTSTLADSSRPEGRKPRMLGCQQWSGKPEAEWDSRCRKSKVLGDTLIQMKINTKRRWILWSMCYTGKMYAI